jgi:hypothetical protein
MMKEFADKFNGRLSAAIEVEKRNRDHKIAGMELLRITPEKLAEVERVSGEFSTAFIAQGKLMAHGLFTTPVLGGEYPLLKGGGHFIQITEPVNETDSPYMHSFGLDSEHTAYCDWMEHNFPVQYPG